MLLYLLSLFSILSKENLGPDECIAVSVWNGFLIGDCVVQQ